VLCEIKKVFVTDAHLGVALEYAAGGELFDTVAKAGKLPEIEARYFFQQLVLGLEYCHNRVGSISRAASATPRCNEQTMATNSALGRVACSAAADSTAGVHSRGWCTVT
jgi:Protein kinase domain